jgi:hypothetical protein
MLKITKAQIEQAIRNAKANEGKPARPVPPTPRGPVMAFARGMAALGYEWGSRHPKVAIGW